MSLFNDINTANKGLEYIYERNNKANEANKQAFNNNTFFESFKMLNAIFSIYNYFIKENENIFSDIEVEEMKDIIKEATHTFDMKYANSNVSTFKHDVDSLNKKTSVAWKNYITNKTNDIYNDLLIYNIIASDKDVNMILNILTKIRESWPISISLYDTYSKSVEIVEKKVLDNNFDDNIKQFLRKAIEGNATLIDLDEEVLSWIKANKYESKLKISMK